MRIAMICTEKLPVPPIRGGAIQTYIDGILPHLATEYELTVYCRRDRALPDEETRDGVRYVRVDPGSSVWTYGSAVADHLAHDTPDVVHLFNRPMLVPLLHQAAPRSRMVLSVHNEMFTPRKLAEDVGADIVRRVDRIVTISNFIQSGIRRRFPGAANKMRTIYSAADINRFLPRWHPEAQAGVADLRKELELGDSPAVVYVGRLSPKKGAHVVIEAMHRLQNRGARARLVVVGSKWYGGDDADPYIEQLQTAADRLPHPATFTGYVPYSEVHRYFWLADAFVCASQWEEPLSRTHYEAMAVGAPIITTDRGGNAEVVRGYGNGVVVGEYDSPRAMAYAIRHILNHPHTAAEMGRRGRALAEHRYTWPRVATEIQEVYRVLNGAGKQGSEPADRKRRR